MNPSHLLLWIVFLSCFSLLVRTAQMPAGERQGWVWVAGGIVTVTLAAIALIPDWAALVGGSLWLMLVAFPALVSARVHGLTVRDRYDAALQWIRWGRWLHPSDSWRQQVHLLRSLALAKSGNLAGAIAYLKPHQTMDTAFGRRALALEYRLEARWQELLAWLQQLPPEVLAKDGDLLVYYWRSLGETGALNELIASFAARSPLLESRNDSRRLHLGRLFVLAFCGRQTAVQRLLDGFLGQYADTFRVFWWVTASLAAGAELNRAQPALEGLKTLADPILQAAIAWRLQHPTPDLSQAIASESQKLLERIETDFWQEERYTWGSTSIGHGAYATFGLVGINLLVFALEVFLGGDRNFETLYRLGAAVPAAIVQGEWWRLLAANFLHYGALHLGSNMLGLLFLGRFVETALGVRRYLLCYFTSGCGAMLLLTAIAVATDSLDGLVVGASAAIMGLVGAIAAILLHGWRRDKSRMAARKLRTVLFVIGLQVAFDLTTPQVSLLGHLSGLLLGFLTVSLLLWRGRSLASRTR